MSDLITSIRNPRIKAVADLREPRERRERGLILIDGRREIERAFAAGVVCDEVYVCHDLLDSDRAQALLVALRERGAAVVAVSVAVFEKIAYGRRADGILVIARRPNAEFRYVPNSARPLCIVIDGIEKPGNIGAIARTADAAGAAAVVVTDPMCDCFGPNAIRASTGAVFTVPIMEAPSNIVRDRLVDAGVQIIAAMPDAKRPYTEYDYTLPTALILGSEARGLEAAWIDCAAPAGVPMMGRCDSLNVSVTAAVFCYEALRQRLQ